MEARDQSHGQPFSLKSDTFLKRTVDDEEGELLHACLSTIDIRLAVLEGNPGLQKNPVFFFREGSSLASPLASLAVGAAAGSASSVVPAFFRRFFSSLLYKASEDSISRSAADELVSRWD